MLVPLFAAVRFDEVAESRVRQAAQQGVPVYVMRTASLLYYLYFNYLFLARGLPLSKFANEIQPVPRGPFYEWIRRHIRALLVRNGPSDAPDPVSSGFLSALVENGDPVFLFLHRPTSLSDRWFARSAPDPIRALILAQRRMSRPILLVPQLMVSSKTPEQKERSWIDAIFGDREDAGPLRRVGRFLSAYYRTFVLVGEPLNLQRFLEEEGRGRSDEALARVLRRMLGFYLFREKKVVQGPRVRPRRKVLERVARADEVQTTLSALSLEQSRPLPELERKVRRYLERISADISLTWIDLANHFLRQVWNRIYDGISVQQEELQRLRHASRDAAVVLIPNHRSHTDYLLLSYILYNADIAVPHIAAGINLSFWPMGPLFRRMGAFFVQRTFKNDRLGPVLLKQYVWALLRDGYTLEFFIEGGRSRTGAFLQPRLGMLSMVVDFCSQASPAQDVVLVPVSIAYERVVELKSFVHEMRGGVKRPENLAQVLKSGSTLANRYGHVDVGFLAPISLRALLASLPEPLSPDMPWEEKRRVLEPLGKQILEQIASRQPVSMNELVATALLNHPKRGILEVALHARVQRLRTLFAVAGKPVAVTDLRSEVDRALRVFIAERHIIEHREGRQRILSIREGRHLHLDYYRNAVLTPLVSEGMLATVMGSFSEASGPWEDVQRRFQLLSELWEEEFIFDPQRGASGYLERALERLELLAIVRQEEQGGRLVCRLWSGDRALLEELQALVRAYLEGYYLALRAITVLEEAPMREKELLQHLATTARTLYMTGELERQEATSQLLLRSALRRLQRLGVLLPVDTAGVRGDGEWRLEPGTHQLWADLLRALLGLER